MTWWANESPQSSLQTRLDLNSLISRISSYFYGLNSYKFHKFFGKLFFKHREHEIRVKSGIKITTGESLSIEMESSLPSLAWIAVQNHIGWNIKIGPGVETTHFGFYEGVWDSNFKTSTPVSSEAAFGSGAIYSYPKPDSICFLVSRNPYEQVWVLQNSSETYISNTLAFVLEESGLETNSPMFESLCESLVFDTFQQGKSGVDRQRALTAEFDDAKLFRFVYFDFAVDKLGKIQRLWTSPSKPPYKFEDYKSFLQETLEKLHNNASHVDRKTKFSPLVALSSGYDSAAVAVLTQNIPHLQSVTLDVKVLDVEDSGVNVARYLGIPLRSYPHVISNDILSLRIDFSGQLREDILEFVGTAGIGDDITFLAFEDSIKSSLFFTGAYGDSIWSLQKDLAPGLSLGIPFGKSLCEFRLRSGFVHIPVPTIGARFNRPIKQMANSKAMRNWSVGGSYDRPIPRRLGEDAGLPRGSFGISKAATAPLALNHHELFPDGLKLVMRRYREKNS
jgi:hypothetical protein